MKKIVAILLALVFCLSTSTIALAAEVDTPIDEEIIEEDIGWNSDYGYFGSFNVYLPSGSSSSTGQITIRIYAQDQDALVYLYVIDPNGHVVMNAQNQYGNNIGLAPNNGAEHYSDQFSNAVAGNYTVVWTSLGYVNELDCWVYNW